MVNDIVNMSLKGSVSNSISILIRVVSDPLNPLILIDYRLSWEV